MGDVLLSRCSQAIGLLGIALVWALPAAPQDLLTGPSGGSAPFDVTADQVDFETDRSIYIARGNVVITQPDRTLTADWVAFSNVTQQGVATGNVVIHDGGDTLYADVLHFELDQMKGIVYDGRLDGAGSAFRMTGDQILKTGDETYIFENGMFTTCHCPADETEPWVLKAKEATLQADGWAVTKNTTVEVLGVPVLWLPWMRYPLKADRKTGFLFPEISQADRSGWSFGLPFFWAAADSLNVLITPRYLTDRGFKPEIEFDYVMGRRSYGELYATYIDDNLVVEDTPETPFDSQRWAIDWVHDQELPGGWRWKVDGRWVSDNLYTFDFDDLSAFSRDRYLEALTFVEKRFGMLGRYGFTAALQFADDMQNPDNLDRDDFLVNRLPDLRLAAMPKAFPILKRRLFSSFDLRYTHFWARDDAKDILPQAQEVDGIFLDTGIDALPNGQEILRRGGRVLLEDGSVRLGDGTVLTAEEFAEMFPMAMLPSPDAHMDDFPGPERDGIFQEGEALSEGGHRFVVNPRFFYPFRIADTVEVLPEFGWYGTFYSTDKNGSPVRSLFTAQIDVRARLRRKINLPFGIGPVTHLMEPRFAYTGITSDDQDDSPLFIPRPFVLQKRLRQLDLWNVVRDPADRIEAVNAITFGLGNRFYRATEEEGAPPRLFADVSFSFQEDFEDEALRSFFIDGTIFPYNDFQARFNLGYDFDETELDEILIQGGWFSESGNDLAAGYRGRKEIPRFFESFNFDEERFEDFNEGFLEISQFDFFARWAVTRHWALTYRAVYSFEDEDFLANAGAIEYVSRCLCWAVRVELADRRSRGFQFRFAYKIIGLGDDTVRPFSGRQRRRGQDTIIDTPQPADI